MRYRSFFELVRFDFVLDENMNVYAMEVNMSPNLSSGHFTGNARLYRQVIYNTLSLVGISSKTDHVTTRWVHAELDGVVFQLVFLRNSDSAREFFYALPYA